MTVPDALRAYHPDQMSLYHPEMGPTVFGIAWLANVDAVCAELARLAYVRFERNGKTGLQNILQQGGFGDVTIFSKKGTQAFAVCSTDGKSAFVSFRGTQPGDYTDLVTDIEAGLVAARGFPGLVHSGFIEALHDIWDDVNDWVDKLPADVVLTATGHSLGAALATLAASQWRRAQLINFGSPRVGNDEFAQAFAGRKVRRYVDCCDVVTRLPPEVGFFQYTYKHIDSPLVIDESGKVLATVPDDGEMNIMRIRAAFEYEKRHAFHAGNVAVRDLADHAPANYLRVFLDPI